MGENPIPQNKTGGGNELGGGTRTMVALTKGQQQGTGGGEYRMVRADGGCENVWASSDHTGVL